MNVVDSSGWIEYLVGGPNADFFAAPLSDAAVLVVPALSLFEVYRWVLRERGREAALTVAASMRQGRVVPLDAELAIEAAELAQASDFPLADATIYATARVHGARVWTQDVDFEGLEGVMYRARG